MDTTVYTPQEIISTIHNYNDDRAGIMVCQKKFGKRESFKRVHTSTVADAVQLNFLEQLGLMDNLYNNQNSLYLVNNTSNPVYAIRNDAGLRNLSAVWVDLDFYNKFDEETPADVIISLIKFDELYQIAPWNLVADSGRGAYILWLIDKTKTFPEQLALWNLIADNLYSRLREYGSCRNGIYPSAVLRYPGSVNTKAAGGAGRRVEWQIEDDNFRYGLEDLAGRLGIEYKALPQKKRAGEQLSFKGKEFKKKKNNCKKKFNEYTLMHSRLADIKTLAGLRGGIIEGLREQNCFLYQNCLRFIYADMEIVADQVRAFNGGFCDPPLERKELQKFFKSKDIYKFSNQNLISRLDISIDEQKSLSTIIGRSEKYRRNNIRRRAVRRDQSGLTKRARSARQNLCRVLEVWESRPSDTLRGLARSVGLSHVSVYDYLKKAGLGIARQKPVKPTKRLKQLVISC